MRVLCRNGHFAFYPKDAEEISRFVSYFVQPLFRIDDYYTFPILTIAEKYSVLGSLYGGVTATKTYEGQPWEVMKENGFVIDLLTGLLTLKTSVTTMVNLQDMGSYFIPRGVLLIQPGSIDPFKGRVMSYDADFDLRTSQMKIYEMEFELL